MTLLERPRSRPDVQPQDGPAGDPAGGNLRELRQQTQQVWDDVDQAIERALSGDSEAFLAATEQQGGE